MQAQLALALLSSKLVRGPGTKSLPSTFASPDHPHQNRVDVDEVAHNEPPHLDLHYLPSGL